VIGADWQGLEPLPYIPMGYRPPCAEPLWCTVFRQAGDYSTGKDITLAKQVCARCPLMTQCLEYAESTGQRWGVWGGKTFTSDRSRAGKWSA
jgi:hypothetical protein